MTDFGHTIGDARKRGDDDADNVVELHRGSTNLACAKCGSEWWIVQAVVIDNETAGINGYAGMPRCYECAGGDLVPLGKPD